MQIKTIAWTMLGTIILLFLLTGVCIVILDITEHQKMIALQRQAEFKQLGIDLANASDYLTNEVRGYVQFGDKTHFDNYWREVNTTKTRDRVVKRLGELGAPENEMTLIGQAKNNSDALIVIEEQAMAAVIEGDYTSARHLMFDQQYNAYKKSIMDPISQFQQAMNDRAVAEVEKISSISDLMLVLSNVFILLSAVVTTTMVYQVMIRRTVYPVMSLTTSMRQLAEGDTGIIIPETRNNDEISEMISAVEVFRVNAIERNRLELKQAEYTAELDKKNQQLGKALDQLEGELEIARQMQLSILPINFPDRPDLEAYGKMIAARELGGDFYDVIEIDQDRIGFIIADVSGKGVPAALFMAVSCTVMKSIAIRGGGPGETLEKVNQVLSQENEASMFVTLFYGIIDIRSHQLIYANAGHNPPYLMNPDETITLLEGTGGVALGVVDGLKYAEISVSLASGGTIFCYTDGVTDATDADGNEFSESRLLNVLGDAFGLSVESLCARVTEHVEAFAGLAEQFDDITYMVLRYLPTSASTVQADKSTITAKFHDGLVELDALSAMVEKFCQQNNLPSSLAYQLTLVLDESLTNIFSYGFEDDDNGNNSIDLSMSISDGSLEMELQDNGMAFDPLDAKEPDLEVSLEDRPIGGLGIYFVKTIMDTISYQRKQGLNVLTMSKKL